MRMTLRAVRHNRCLLAEDGIPLLLAVARVDSRDEAGHADRAVSSVVGIDCDHPFNWSRGI